MSEVFLQQESHLVGVTDSGVSATGTSIRAKFWSKHDSNISRTPEYQKMILLLNRGRKNQESILVSAHNTDSDGFTTLTIEKRNLKNTGYEQISDPSTEAFEHTENETIECVSSHWLANIVQAWFDGQISDAAGVKNVLQENGDTKIFIGTSYFLRKSTGEMFYSENGSSELPMGGAGSISAGNGLGLDAGVFSILLATNTPFEFSDGKLSIRQASDDSGEIGDVVTVAADGKIDKSLLQNAVRNDDIENWENVNDESVSAEKLFEKFEEFSAQINTLSVGNLLILKDNRSDSFSDNSYDQGLSFIQFNKAGRVKVSAYIGYNSGNYGGAWKAELNGIVVESGVVGNQTEEFELDVAVGDILSWRGYTADDYFSITNISIFASHDLGGVIAI